MEENQVPKRPTVIKYSLILTGALIAYFLILVFSGLIRFAGLRMVNYLLISIAIYMAFKEIKQKSLPEPVTYLGGMGMGFMIVLITSILFSLFIMVYGMFINPAFINVIWKNPFYYNTTANASAMAAYMFSETLFFGIILDLIMTQFFKWGVPPESEEE